MPINRSPVVRSDFPFLTRRVRPQPAAGRPPEEPAVQSGQPTQQPVRPPSLSLAPPPSAPPSSAPSSSTESRPVQPASLSLSLSPAAEASAARGQAAGPRSSAGPLTPENPRGGHSRGSVASRLFPAPGMDEVRSLDARSPVVRLSPLQSAVGSLLVAGTRAVVWEATDLTSGARTAESARAEILGAEVQTSGNRPLVGYTEGVAAVPLRHIGELRRALFIPKSSTAMLVEIFDGSTLVVPFDTADAADAREAGSAKPLVQVLSLLRVGNQVELRAEALPAGMALRAIWEEFGFSMTQSVAAHLRRN